jgi:hypothetical protein
MFIKSTIALLLLNSSLLLISFAHANQPKEDNTQAGKVISTPIIASQQTQKAAWKYIKQIAKISAWTGLTYCTTACIIRTFFNQQSNARLSKQQLIALIPVAIASGYVYYCLLLKKKKDESLSKQPICSSEASTGFIPAMTKA